RDRAARGRCGAEAGAHTRVTRVARRPLRARALWLLGTLLQLLLPGAAAWADASLDAASAHATAHIESHTSRSCARIHAPDCALCHFLTAPALRGRAATLRLYVADTRPVHASGPTRQPRPPAPTHPHLRARPRIS